MTNYSDTNFRTTSATSSMTSWHMGSIKVDKQCTTYISIIYHRILRNYKRINRALAGHKYTMDNSPQHGYRPYRPTTHRSMPFSTIPNASLLCGKQSYKYGQSETDTYTQAPMNRKIAAIWKWTSNKSSLKPNLIPTYSHLLNISHQKPY